MEMNIDQEAVKEFLVESGCEDAIVFQNPDYARAFIGHDWKGRAVYNFDEMIQCLMTDDHMTYDEAADYVLYNTLRATDYMGDMAPIVLFSDAL